MSDPLPLAELPIRNRNRLDRVSVVVTDHHKDIDALKIESAKQRQHIAQMEQRLLKMESTINVMRAMAQGTGPTA